MKREWRNHYGTPCWGEEYKSAAQVEALSDDQIKDIVSTGVCLTEDKQHVVCWYVLKSGDALYIVSGDDAQVVARMADTGETMSLTDADASKRLYSAGYIVPGPIINCGNIDLPSGSVNVPASMIGTTIWTGTGYIHDPDR